MKRKIAAYFAAIIAGALMSGCGEWKKPLPAPKPSPQAAPHVELAPEPAAPPQQVKAAVGVGAKGHYDGVGPVVTPIHAYFAAKERVVFEIQIPKTMQIYKAEHDNHGPKTHEQFMKEIIQEGMIKLPELPAGDRYIYDPVKEELMVEKGGR